jgi:hypothetical protein
MVNAMKPTKCSWHIDIQSFTMQDWQQQGHIWLHHIIPDITNLANDLIKALGWSFIFIMPNIFWTMLACPIMI